MTLSVILKFIALICYIGLAAITLVRGHRRGVVRLLVVYLGAMAFWQVSALVISFSRNAEQALTWYRALTAGASVHLIVYFFFVREFLSIRGQRILVHIGYVACAVTVLLPLLAGDQIIEDVYLVERTGLYVPTFGPFVVPLAISGYFFLAAGVYNLTRRYRRSDSELERNRLKYLLLGITIVILGTIANYFPTLRPYPIDIAANTLNAFCIAYAILRYQLLDITLVIRKGLVYTVPTAIIGSAYYLLVLLATRLFQAVSGIRLLLVSLVVAALTAVGLEPLWDWAQTSVDRLFFREKYDSQRMLQRVSRTAASVLDLERLTHMLVSEIVQTIHIEKAAFFLRQDETEEYTMTAHHGVDPGVKVHFRKDHPIVEWFSTHPSPLRKRDIDLRPHFQALWKEEWEDLELLDAELFVPVRAKQRLVGILVLGPKLSETAYSRDESVILTTLCNQVAVAMENARLHRQLQEYAADLEQRVEERTMEIQAQYARLEAILNSTADGIVVTTPAGEVIKTNPVADRWLDLTLPPEQAQKLREAVRDLGRQAATQCGKGEQVQQLIELDAVDLQLRARPVVDPEAERVAAVVDLHDVSHLKAIDRMKDKFISNVSHQLRTPITTVKLYAHLMKNHPERQDELLDTLIQEADRQVQLIEGILEISQIDTGQLQLQRRPVPLDTLVESAYANYEAVAQKKGIEVNCHTTSETLTVLVDPEKMLQVLNNLMENAIVYTPTGGSVTLSTDLRTTEGRIWAMVNLTDTGLGIPEEELPYIFDRFFRGEDVQSKQIPGTGLGLALVKEIVELHGGRVAVSSEVGVGSTFTVWIPLYSHRKAL